MVTPVARPSTPTGQVVGVNTAIYSPSGGNVGIGFAIPSSTVKDVVAALRDKGVVAGGYIGVQIQPVTAEIADSLGLKDNHGALIAETQPNTPAAKAGLKSGDVIISVDGQNVDGPRDLSRRIAADGPEHKVSVAYLRSGKEMTANVVLEALPDQQRADARPGRDNGRSEQLDQKFGLSLAPASAVPGAGKEGVVVADVDPDGAGARMGLRSGDVILEAAGQPVTRPSEVSAALAAARKDGRKAVLLRVKSGDNTSFRRAGHQPGVLIPLGIAFDGRPNGLPFAVKSPLYVTHAHSCDRGRPRSGGLSGEILPRGWPSGRPCGGWPGRLCHGARGRL